jgi:hypothetical protein
MHPERHSGRLSVELCLDIVIPALKSSLAAKKLFQIAAASQYEG